MKLKAQVAISIIIIAAASAVVLIQRANNPETQGVVEEGGHDHAAMVAAGERSPVRLDAEASRRIGVKLATAELRSLEWEIEAVGTVTYDETRLATVSPRIEGWVEELVVDFTGAPVERGQPLLEVYSPQLVSAQEELILASRLVAEASSERAAANAKGLLESARRRLEYWDIPVDQIQRIEASGEVTKTLTLRAPASGTVVEKSVVAGDRIVPGMSVYRIADLSRVWIEADVFEKDLGLVRVGQGAAVHFETYPGREFTARVTYVYPTVSLEARTGRIRLELANPQLELKPGMYAHINLDVGLTEPAIVIPTSAILATGERDLVFVEAADGELHPREVTRGRTEGRFAEILRGLEAGERVVSAAAFLVDAESNLGVLADQAMEDMSDDPVMDPAMDDAMDHSDQDMGVAVPDTGHVMLDTMSMSDRSEPPAPAGAGSGR